LHGEEEIDFNEIDIDAKDEYVKKIDKLEKEYYKMRK
jgi:hypothetical protein